MKHLAREETVVGKGNHSEALGWRIMHNCYTHEHGKGMVSGISDEEQKGYSTLTCEPSSMRLVRMKEEGRDMLRFPTYYIPKS